MPDKEKWTQRTAAEYAVAFNNLLPTGRAWPRESGTALQEVVTGQTTIWGTEVEALAALLLTVESDPRATNLLLPDWERAWGLPDICNLVPQTIPQRQTLLVQKITLLGDQSRAFFTGVATKIGYTAAIREWSPFMCGMSMCGDTTNLDPSGHYYWEIGDPVMRFYWATDVTALGAGGGVDLECLFRKWKPGHTVALFDYSALVGLDFEFEFHSDYVPLLTM